jgi:sulfur-oxidizing protein SoxA
VRPSQWLLTALVASVMAAPRAQTLPEQDRQAIIQSIKQRFPGTSPADWVMGAEGLTATPGEVVTAIPFTAENATNSADILAIGRKIWERKFKNGKSMAACFPNVGKRVAATYPQYDAKSKQVITLEGAINRCLQLHREPEIEYANHAIMGPLSAYLRSLSDGQKLAVRVATEAARDRFDAGRTLFRRRIGQLNYACASCHLQHAGGLYGKSGLSPAVGQAANWPRLEPGGKVRTLQMQFQLCMARSRAEPFALGSDELNNLEYYLTFLSNGLTMKTLPTQR